MPWNPPECPIQEEKGENCPMVITKEFLEQGRAENGAWTRAQLEVIGVSWPPKKGWMEAVIGTSVSSSRAEAFTAFRLGRTTRPSAPPQMKKADGHQLREIEERARELVREFTDPVTKAGTHMVTCPERFCHYPACRCL